MQTVYSAKWSSFWSRWNVPLLLLLLSSLVMLAGDDAVRQLRYQREAILEGELWRLFTAHLTHLGWSHLMLNLAGLWLVWSLYGDQLTTRSWWLILLICALAVSLGLLFMNPALQWYVGLSGVLHGLLVAGCLSASLRGHHDSLLILFMLLLKLGWEQWAGPLPGSEMGAGGRVVVDAHLYGAIAGAAALGGLRTIPSWRRQLLPLARDSRKD